MNPDDPLLDSIRQRASSSSGLRCVRASSTEALSWSGVGRCSHWPRSPQMLDNQCVWARNGSDGTKQQGDN